MLAHTPNPEVFGLISSMDFGESWHTLRPYVFGYRNWVATFDTHDTTNIYCAGEEAIFESVIYSSNNDVRDWDLIESVRNNCVHHIAFHPSNPDLMIYSGNNRNLDTPLLFTIYRSTNGGDDWSVFFQTDLPGEGGIIDMELHDNNLFLYTYTDGIYKLSIPKSE
jgi:hypothetical protein